MILLKQRSYGDFKKQILTLDFDRAEAKRSVIFSKAR